MISRARPRRSPAAFAIAVAATLAMVAPAAGAPDTAAPDLAVGADGIYATTLSRCGQGVYVFVQPISPTAASLVSRLPMTVYVSEPTRGLARRQITVFNPGSPTLATGVGSTIFFSTAPSGRGPGALVELEWAGGSASIQTEPYADNCEGTFMATQPRRVLDTRIGVGAAQARVPAGATVDVDLGPALDGRTSGVTSVVANLTATAPASAGYITAFACGDKPPTASNLNFAAGQTAPNLVVVDLVGISPPGHLCLFASTETDLILDVTGYYIDDPTAAGGSARFNALTLPQRLVDTRSSVAVAAGATLRVATAGRMGIPDGPLSAVSLNLTVTEPTSAGFLTAYPCDTDLPTASNVNFVAGQTRPNAVIVAAGTNGDVCVYSSATAHVIVDIVGYYGSTGRSLWAHVPTRRWDSRLSVPTNATTPRKLGARQWFTYSMPSTYQPGDIASFNVTITDPDAAGFATVYPCVDGVPGSSNLNFVAGETVANAVQVRVDVNRTICFTPSVGAHIIIDLGGTFYAR